MKNKLLSALFAAVFSNTLLTADNTGGLPGSFLRYGLSARDIAMGRSYTALDDDAGASYRNPSAAAWNRSNELQTSYSALYEDTIDAGLNASFGISETRAFSFSFIERKLGGFKERDKSNRPGKNLNLSENALILSFANKCRKDFSWGLGVKTIYQDIGGFTGRGNGLDAGVMFQPSPSVRCGITVKNLMRPKIKLNKYFETFPLEKRIGIACSPWSAPVLFSLDLQQIENSSPDYFGGISFRVMKNMSLRLGANANEITSGMGISLRSFQIDYAFVTHNSLGNTQRISLNYSFGSNDKFEKIDDLLRKQTETAPEETTTDANILENNEQRIYALENKLDILTRNYAALLEKWTTLATKLLEDTTMQEASSVSESTSAAAIATIAKTTSSITAVIKIARSIRNYQAEDTNTEFDKDIGKLYCWSLIYSEKIPVTVKHIWYFKNRIVAQVPLTVKSGSFRTYSSKKIPPYFTGPWRVELTDENNNVIQSIHFTIR